MRSHLLPALVLTVVAAVVFGLAYPLAIYGIGWVAFRHQADGSFITRNGQTVGSALIGQNFTDKAGVPLPQYFQPRPSAAGARGYDATASGASNLGPGDPRLIAKCLPLRAGSARPGAQACDPRTVPQRARAYRLLNGLPLETPVPVDAVTASASGLDPDISVANADLQAPRVAAARRLPLGRVRDLIKTCTTSRTWGFLGEIRVNVLRLNLALDALRR
ncbi:potassium-transporting ATPase subunit C [Microbispora siamensis]